jgi:hypothetical protein
MFSCPKSTTILSRQSSQFQNVRNIELLYALQIKLSKRRESKETSAAVPGGNSYYRSGTY